MNGTERACVIRLYGFIVNFRLYWREDYLLISMPEFIPLGADSPREFAWQKDRDHAAKQLEQCGKSNAAAKVRSFDEQQYARLNHACDRFSYGVTSLSSSALDDDEILAWIDEACAPIPEHDITSVMKTLRQKMEATLDE